MILAQLAGRYAANSGPRACGDDPTGAVDVVVQGLWTPRMRG